MAVSGWVALAHQVVDGALFIKRFSIPRYPFCFDSELTSIIATLGGSD